MTAPLGINLSADGALLRLVLNRPKANIIDAEMIAALDPAFSDHLASTDLKAGLLSAEGPHFRFGASVSEQLPDSVAAMLLNANSFYPWDFRVATSGSVVGSGLAIAGITEDIDAQTRADPPTIGASEGVSSFGTSSGGGRRTRGRYHAI